MYPSVAKQPWRYKFCLVSFSQRAFLFVLLARWSNGNVALFFFLRVVFFFSFSALSNLEDILVCLYMLCTYEYIHAKRWPGPVFRVLDSYHQPMPQVAQCANTACMIRWQKKGIRHTLANPEKGSRSRRFDGIGWGLVIRRMRPPDWVRGGTRTVPPTHGGDGDPSCCQTGCVEEPTIRGPPPGRYGMRMGINIILLDGVFDLHWR